MKSIVLIEDDAAQRELTAALLSRYLPDHNLHEIVSEEQFLCELSKGVLDDCNVLIVDVMLAWTSLDRFVEEPPKYQGYYEGGLRCIEELRSSQSGKRIPVIIYTLLESQDLSTFMKRVDRVIYISKSQPQELIKQLRCWLEPEHQTAIN